MWPRVRNSSSAEGELTVIFRQIYWIFPTSTSMRYLKGKALEFDSEAEIFGLGLGLGFGI